MAQEGRDEKGKFTAGNLFRVGMAGHGLNPNYEDAETMSLKIAEYLDWEDNQKDKANKGVYTLSGCALYLGFSSRQSLYDYEKRSPSFSYVIERFRTFMTHWNEQKLYWGGTYMGSQFWLRNHGGYSDESTQNLKQTITEVKPEVMGGTPPIAEQ